MLRKNIFDLNKRKGKKKHIVQTFMSYHTTNVLLLEIKSEFEINF